MNLFYFGDSRQKTRSQVVSGELGFDRRSAHSVIQDIKFSSWITNSQRNALFEVEEYPVFIKFLDYVRP